MVLKKLIKVFAIGVFVVPLMSTYAYAEKVTVNDDVSGEVVLTYDTDTREVEVGNVGESMLNKLLRAGKYDFGWQRNYVDGEEIAFQYLFYGDFNEYRARNGVRHNLIKNNFRETYGFIPSRITYKDVTYELNGSSEDATLEITSTGGNKIYLACIDAFDVRERRVPHKHDDDDENPPKVKLVHVIVRGSNIDELPACCFQRCPYIKSLDLKETRINKLLYVLDYCGSDGIEEDGDDTGKLLHRVFNNRFHIDISPELVNSDANFLCAPIGRNLYNHFSVEENDDGIKIHHGKVDGNFSPVVERYAEKLTANSRAEHDRNTREEEFNCGDCFNECCGDWCSCIGIFTSLFK